MLVAGAFDPLDHEVFQSVFGAIMTLLIAMEFIHSIIRVIERRESIIQVKTVVLIAIMALARKFIILDASTKDAAMLAALAAVMLVRGVVYWLMRDNSQTARMEDVNKPKLHAVHAMAIKEDGEQRHGCAEHHQTASRSARGPPPDREHPPYSREILAAPAGVGACLPGAAGRRLLSDASAALHHSRAAL